MSELPKGWARARVGEVGQVQLGRQRSPEHHRGPKMRPYLRVANVFEGFIDTSDVMSMNFSDDEYQRYVLRPGDILLNEGQSKELVGRPAIYNGEVPGACFTNSLVRYSPSPALDPRFAYQVFRHFLHSGEFQKIAQITTNIAHLGAGRFAEMELVLPPVPEQRRIVAKLDGLFERSRKAKESLDRIPAMLERLRQSILAAAFRGDLTKEWREAHPDVEPASVLLEKIRAERRQRWEDGIRAKGKDPSKAKYEEPAPLQGDGLPDLPTGWAWTTLEHVSGLVTDGDHNPPKRVPSGIPHLTAKNIKGESIVLDGCSFISPEDYDRVRKRYEPLPNDIIITCVGTLGECAIVPSGLTFSPDRNLAAVRVWPNGMDEKHLLNVLLAPRQQAIMTAGSGSTAQPHLYLSTLRSLPIPVAPKLEQTVINRSVAGALAVIEHRRQTNERQAEHLSSLERSLLAKTFRGELVPQDPNDEPASVLLERIRAERAAADSASQSRRRKAG